MADILIMEPDRRVGRRMCEILTKAGHTCTSMDDAAQGIQFVRQGERMLTILNAQLPWTDSFNLLRSLEEKGWPVLFITSDPGNADHLRAMYQAGCDVLLSPFDGHALIKAVAALLDMTSRMMTLGPLCLDVTSRTATFGGESLSLTAQEFALLRALMQSPDAAVTREQLLRTAWGYQTMGETRTVDVHIQRLRRKLGATCIETVYKMGYRLKLA